MQGNWTVPIFKHKITLISTRFALNISPQKKWNEIIPLELTIMWPNIHQIKTRSGWKASHYDLSTQSCMYKCWKSTWWHRFQRLQSLGLRGRPSMTWGGGGVIEGKIGDEFYSRARECLSDFFFLEKGLQIFHLGRSHSNFFPGHEKGLWFFFLRLSPFTTVGPTNFIYSDKQMDGHMDRHSQTYYIPAMWSVKIVFLCTKPDQDNMLTCTINHIEYSSWWSLVCPLCNGSCPLQTD